jgi:hypothetical protein
MKAFKRNASLGGRVTVSHNDFETCYLSATSAWRLDDDSLVDWEISAIRL